MRLLSLIRRVFPLILLILSACQHPPQAINDTFSWRSQENGPITYAFTSHALPASSKENIYAMSLSAVPPDLGFDVLENTDRYNDVFAKVRAFQTDLAKKSSAELQPQEMIFTIQAVDERLRSVLRRASNDVGGDIALGPNGLGSPEYNKTVIDIVDFDSTGKLYGNYLDRQKTLGYREVLNLPPVPAIVGKTWKIDRVLTQTDFGFIPLNSRRQSEGKIVKLWQDSSGERIATYHQVIAEEVVGKRIYNPDQQKEDYLVKAASFVIVDFYIDRGHVKEFVSAFTAFANGSEHPGLIANKFTVLRLIE